MMKLREYNFTRTVDVLIHDAPLESIRNAVHSIDDKRIEKWLDREIVSIHKTTCDLDSIILIASD